MQWNGFRRRFFFRSPSFARRKQKPHRFTANFNWSGAMSISRFFFQFRMGIVLRFSEQEIGQIKPHRYSLYHLRFHFWCAAAFFSVSLSPTFCSRYTVAFGRCSFPYGLQSKATIRNEIHNVNWLCRVQLRTTIDHPGDSAIHWNSVLFNVHFHHPIPMACWNSPFAVAHKYIDVNACDSIGIAFHTFVSMRRIHIQTGHRFNWTQIRCGWIENGLHSMWLLQSGCVRCVCVRERTRAEQCTFARTLTKNTVVIVNQREWCRNCFWAALTACVIDTVEIRNNNNHFSPEGVMRCCYGFRIWEFKQEKWYSFVAGFRHKFCDSHEKNNGTNENDSREEIGEWRCWWQVLKQ